MKSKLALLLLTLLLLASCSTHKAAIDEGAAATPRASDPAIAFVNDVIAAAATTENIVGNAAIRLAAGSESIRLSGALRLRRDKVVRLQLMVPLLGTEVGRMEFTPDYVLIVDRMNKQYVKVNYSEVDFLQRNGITFATLQALFWDELVPINGSRATTASDYAVDLSSDTPYVPITLTIGDTQFAWQANRKDNTLAAALITHTSATAGTAMLTWMYSNYTSVAGKPFPLTQEFSFSTMINGTMRKAEVTIDMSDVKTTGDWAAETDISEKYKEVSVETVLRRLMSF